MLDPVCQMKTDSNFINVINDILDLSPNDKNDISPKPKKNRLLCTNYKSATYRFEASEG